jgi:hypothetical protein
MELCQIVPGNFYIMYSSRYFASIFIIFTSAVDAQYNQVIETNAEGSLIWRPQPTASSSIVSAVASSAPAAQPTLVWNCQQMPAICINVYNWLLQNGESGAMSNSMSMVYDLNRTHAEKRQDRMCGTSTWKSHVCPDTPLAVPNNLYAPLQAGVIDPFFYPNIGRPATSDMWIIPGPAGGTDPSGLKYSCDEYVNDICF